MKTWSVHKPSGNTLVVCVVTMGVVGLVLVSYLQLGSTHQVLTARSRSWNAALPVAESGIEEALTHLNWNRGLNLASQGWVQQGNTYTKTRSLSPDSYYVAQIRQTGPRFELRSSGYQRLPLSADHVSRTIIATAVRTNLLFTKALIAKKHIRCGKCTIIDSFDSTDPKHSASGKYVASKRKDTASIAATSSKKNAVKVEKTKIYGDGATAPKGNFEFKSGGALGSIDWIDKLKRTGPEPGKLSHDFRFDFPPVRPPWTSGGITPTGGKYKGDKYDYILGTGNYQLDKIDLKEGMIVTNGSTAVLYVTGDFKADENIIIEKNATLILFMAGRKFEVADKNIVVNDGLAVQFQYYGLPSNKEVKIKKNGELAALLYAPSAKIKIEGDGDAIGSFVGKCVHFKKGGQLHYDEGINKRGSFMDFYALASWREQ